MTLPLKASSTSGDKTPYTDEEKNLAGQILTCLLPLADQEVKKEIEVSDEVQNLCTEIAQNGGHSGLDTMVRDCFRTHIKNTCGGAKDFIGNDSFPKVRDPTSIQLIMRKGLEMVGREDLKDVLFKRYGQKETKKA